MQSKPIHYPLSIILFVFFNCIGIEKPIQLTPNSFSSGSYKINIHNSLGMNTNESLKPEHIFLFFLGTQGTNSLLESESSLAEKSPYILSAQEDREVTIDSISAIAVGDFEPEKRKLQAANLKIFQEFIQSKEFAETYDIIGSPPNYEKGWTMSQVQASYVTEIKEDLPKATNELIILYRRMINFQLFNMLDM